MRERFFSLMPTLCVEQLLSTHVIWETAMKVFFWIMALVWLCLSSGCAATQPTVEIFGIGGDALIDINGNGRLDSVDLPLPNAKFTVTDRWGVSNSQLTDAYGHALVGPPSEAYPMTLQMESPSGGRYKVVGTDKVVFSRAELIKNGLGAKFLLVAVPLSTPTKPVP